MSGRHPDRRDFLTLGVGALAVAALPGALRRAPVLVRRRIPVMGTVAEIAVRHPDEPWAQRSIDLALEELRRVDRTMSRFRADSDVGRLNAARGGVVAVSDDTAEVLEAALAWHDASEGRFDPCLGAWTRGGAGADARVGAEEADPDLPSPARFLEVDRHGTVPRVRLHRPDLAVDLGAIAKGHAVDLAARILRERGLFHALVNAGGDLVAMGVDGEGEPWRVGVRDPRDPDGVVAVLPVSDRALATSGTYLQGPHLLDPRTGAPLRAALRSLTVDASSCRDADAAATAVFAVEPARREALLAAGAADARIAHLL